MIQIHRKMKGSSVNMSNIIQIRRKMKGNGLIILKRVGDVSFRVRVQPSSLAAARLQAEGTGTTELPDSRRGDRQAAAVRVVSEAAVVSCHVPLLARPISVLRFWISQGVHSSILNLRGGILMSIGNFLNVLGQRILVIVRIILVIILGVSLIRTHLVAVHQLISQLDPQVPSQNASLLRDPTMALNRGAHESCNVCWEHGCVAS